MGFLVLLLVLLSNIFGDFARGCLPKDGRALQKISVSAYRILALLPEGCASRHQAAGL